VSSGEAWVECNGVGVRVKTAEAAETARGLMVGGRYLEAEIHTGDCIRGKVDGGGRCSCTPEIVRWSPAN
jgi:hypothetical protein